MNKAERSRLWKEAIQLLGKRIIIFFTISFPFGIFIGIILISLLMHFPIFIAILFGFIGCAISVNELCGGEEGLMYLHREGIIINDKIEDILLKIDELRKQENCPPD